MTKDLEYLTSNRLIRYPFADNSVVNTGNPKTDSELKSRLLFGCFSDAAIQMKASFTFEDVKITQLAIQGHTLKFAITNGHTSTVLSCTRTTTKFPVVYGATDWCWYTFVLSSDGIRALEENVESVGNVTSQTFSLNTKCLGVNPPQVTSIAIYGGSRINELTGKRLTLVEALSEKPDVIVTGDTGIREGYNIKLGAGIIPLSFLSAENSIVINAVAGAGMGTAPCSCIKKEVEFKTPGLIASDGNLRLFNDTCYDLVPNKKPAVESDKIEGTLEINAKCKACCTCDMYASIVNDQLVPLKERIIHSRDMVTKVFSTYEDNVTKWNERIANASPEDVVISLTGVALDAAGTNLIGGDVAGRMSRCGYTLTIRNDAFVPLEIRLSQFSSNGAPFEAQVSYMQDADTPVVMPLDLSQPEICSITLVAGRTLTVTYFTRLSSMSKTDRQQGFLSSMKVEAYQGTRQIISTTKTLMI